MRHGKEVRTTCSSVNEQKDMPYGAVLRYKDGAVCAVG